ncbi:MAG TPA: MCE family protein, partial [Synergistaceae bacterium]|nr:MCE family protein [Synergistaceae bacterium]
WGELWGGYVHGDLGGGALWDMKTIGLPLALSWQWWDEDGGEWYVQGEWRVTDRWGLFYRHYEDDDDTESVGVSYRF